MQIEINQKFVLELCLQGTLKNVVESCIQGATFVISYNEIHMKIAILWKVVFSSRVIDKSSVCVDILIALRISVGSILFLLYDIIRVAEIHRYVNPCGLFGFQCLDRIQGP